MLLIIIVVVSVFLFSCGIPTYWEPSNSTVISKNSSEEDPVSFNVTVNYYAGDDGDNAPNIGLLLLYVYTNTDTDTSSNSSFYNALVKEFNSSYRGTKPSGISTLKASYNTSIWSFTYDDETFNVYAFTDSNDESVEAYKYNKDISNNEDFSTKYTLRLKETKTDGVELFIDNSTTLDSSFSFGLSEDNLNDLNEAKYIHVYAAISAQGNYSNIYWSDLVYVGSFEN